jgi:hypothetical protein
MFLFEFILLLSFQDRLHIRGTQYALNATGSILDRKKGAIYYRQPYVKVAINQEGNNEKSADHINVIHFYRPGVKCSGSQRHL